jgi:hypothetical protein
MSEILNENQADKIVIINLLKEIKRIRELHKMGKLLIDVNGDVYFSEVHTLLAESDVDSKVNEAREQIAEFEKVNELSDKLKAVSEAAATEAPAPAPVHIPVAEVPTQVETPAPVEQPQVIQDMTPATPEQPIVPQPITLQ